MNRVIANKSLLNCGLPFISPDAAENSRAVYIVFIIRTAINATTCPLIIFLNIMVMISVKTKQRLRTKSNITLACLATTDVLVGLIVQPLQIARYILMIKGEAHNSQFCTLVDVVVVVSIRCVLASVFHLFLISAERYIGIHYPLRYSNMVTETHILLASGIAWIAAIILPTDYLRKTLSRPFLATLAVFIILLIVISTIFYFNISVYIQVRRRKRQIMVTSATTDAKKQLIGYTKAFSTTLILILVMLLSFIPGYICIAIINAYVDKISAEKRYVIFSISSLLPVLNSLFNPLIYVVRERFFRVVFLQLLLRKTISEAKEIERRIFCSSGKIGESAFDQQPPVVGERGAN